MELRSRHSKKEPYEPVGNDDDDDDDDDDDGDEFS